MTLGLEARRSYVQERLHNFFNNRKPKDLKKARGRMPDGSSQDATGEEHQQAEFPSI